MGPYPVLLCGGNPAEQRLAAELARYGAVMRLQRGTLTQLGTGATAFLLYEFDRVPEAALHSGVLLLGSQLPAGRAALPPRLVPVFDSGNAAAVQLLAHRQRAGVACGCAPQDTLSLASLSDTQAVVSLQRELTTLDGARVEPRDLTIRLAEPGKNDAPRELFELMALSAVLLLCGRFSDENSANLRGR